MRRQMWGVVALFGGLMVGCNATNEPQNPDHVFSRTQDALQRSNGRELNGRELNGRELNGRELNGRELNGVSFGGAKLLQGNDIAALTGSQLSVTSGDSTFVGAQVVGAALKGQLDDGSTLKLRIDGAATDPSAADVWRYKISYQTTGDWNPLCGLEPDGSAVEAIALAGTWSYDTSASGGGAHLTDPSSFTFACRHYALAKCVEFGYAPWRVVGGVSLANHHQACTRMLRADYCGDGTSYTLNGTLINVYDGAGVQPDTESWPLEAEWGTDGAVCALHRRFNDGSVLPTCANGHALQKDNCGAVSDFGATTLIMTEYQPPN